MDRSDPQAIADAIAHIDESGLALRETTARWFAENADQLSLESSLKTVLEVYAAPGSSARR